MLDLKFIRENVEQVKKGIQAKNAHVDLDELLNLDKKRRDMIQKADNLKAVRNKASDEIAQLKKNKLDAYSVIERMKNVSAEIKNLDDSLRRVESEIYEIQIRIPNIPHASVPIGPDESHNQLVREWGEKKLFGFEPKPHWELGDLHGILDLDRAARLSGSNFTAFKGAGARLVRGLINFMIDLHVQKHGYEEVWVPFVVRPEIMFGTSQLPKMEEDMYKVEKDDLYLIPTAEVPVTNLHREEILNAEQLPIRYVAYTPCFRREAGSYGADTRGLMRVHQFDKVEMVQLVRPEDSYQALETLVGHAEDVLKLLKLPYRVLSLASGDISFGAAKCYDLEVWASGLNRWLEVSSCSNYEGFQARRMNLRFRREEGGKTEFIHTLNGSGLALPRTIIAIMENYQLDDGRIEVPEVLRDEVGLDIIG
ncbi:serine--tRNA ligase [bacterium]|nr:serine--tRNA ligase [bacterium]